MINLFEAEISKVCRFCLNAEPEESEWVTSLASSIVVRCHGELFNEESVAAVVAMFLWTVSCIRNDFVFESSCGNWIDLPFIHTP